MNWNHKDEWRLRGQDFMVVVSRHAESYRAPSSGCYDEEGPNRWAVYAYIYPEHPHFSAFAGHDLFQDAGAILDLHGGCTFLRRHVGEAGEALSIQVGADYHHLYDTRFTRMATKEAASEVFRDAEDLFEKLQGMAMEATS